MGRTTLKRLILIFCFAVPSLLFAQSDQPAVSAKYPLEAHIVSVETVQQQNHGTGDTSESHLVKAEIGGKSYRLTVKQSRLEKRPFQHRVWLQPGVYPARRTDHGFEFEFKDGDKLRHEELRIATEE
jgi:hypothetical protein